MTTRLPILTFHSIADLASPVAVDASTFRALMARLAAAGWRTVPAADAVAFARGRTELPDRSFLITFDDGYVSVLDHAAPVLREAGFGAVLFLAADLVGRPTIFPGDRLCPRQPALTWEQARELAHGGFEIGSHAVSHRDLRSLDDAQLSGELSESRRILEDKLSAPVRLHAYPFGGCDSRVAAVCAGVYEGAVTTHLDYVSRGASPWLLPRLDAHYLKFLASGGDLAGPVTRSYLGLRRFGRTVRAAFGRGGAR